MSTARKSPHLSTAGLIFWLVVLMAGVTVMTMTGHFGIGMIVALLWGSQLISMHRTPATVTTEKEEQK